MKFKKSDAWEAAEYAYSELHARRMMPLPGMSLSSAQVTARLASIVRACPSFYPAVLELSLRKLAAGAKGAEDERILKGLQLLLDLADPKHRDEEIESLIDNLENLCRFDLAKLCLELLVERFPQQARFRDYLGHATAKLGDVQAALGHANQAVTMAPDNPFFRCNLGWLHLTAGNVDQARTHLTAAQRLDPDNEVTQGNLVILQYITKHGGSLSDFLLRPVDEKKIERLSKKDDTEQLDRLCGAYNRDRLAAFSQWLAIDADKRSQSAAMIDTLTNFFDFVDRVANMAGLLNERIAFVHQHFDAIMNKFIFKFRDVDRKMIADVCGSLLEYYGFLAQHGLVPAEELKPFQDLVRSRKKVLIEKTERYNEVRHDDDLDEDEKEAIREELFGDDHTWPHI